MGEHVAPLLDSKMNHMDCRCLLKEHVFFPGVYALWLFFRIHVRLHGEQFACQAAMDFRRSICFLTQSCHNMSEPSKTSSIRK